MKSKKKEIECLLKVCQHLHVVSSFPLLVERSNAPRFAILQYLAKLLKPLYTLTQLICIQGIFLGSKQSSHNSG